MLLAAIDIGTVTTRLLIADLIIDKDKTGQTLGGDSKIIEIARYMKITHLGAGLAAAGVISAAAMSREVAAAKWLMEKIEECQSRLGRPVETIRVVATSAMRDAKNSQVLIDQLARIGLEVNVISGKKEAELVFSGAISGMYPKETKHSSTILLVDVGGGSTELVLGQLLKGEKRKAKTLRELSLNIGSSKITEKYLKGDPPSFDDVCVAKAYVKDEMSAFFKDTAGIPDEIIAVAGTATTVVSVRDEMVNYDPLKVHGSVVTTDQFNEVFAKLIAVDTGKRKKIIGLEPDRASVILGGLIILQQAINLSGLSSFTVSESDILQGILYDLAKDL